MEIISTGTAIVAAGAWFAEKIVGPSAVAIGDQLKAFTNARLNKIFKKAEEKSTGLNVKPLHPGLIYHFIQRSSFSEDDELLTLLWANLLVSAAQGANSRHALFISILSELGPTEAKTLAQIADDRGRNFRISRRPSSIISAQREVLRTRHPAPAENRDGARAIADSIMSESLLWPGQISDVDVPYPSPDLDRVEWLSCQSNFDPLTIDILLRQRLLEWFDVELDTPGPYPRVKGVIMTALGVEFIMCCHGADRTPVG